MCKKDYIWNPRTCTCGNGKCLESIIDDSVIIWDEIIDFLESEPKNTASLNFKDKKMTCKMSNFYILLTFSLIPILLLIIVSIYYYYYHKKHQSKE